MACIESDQQAGGSQNSNSRPYNNNNNNNRRYNGQAVQRANYEWTVIRIDIRFNKAKKQCERREGLFCYIENIFEKWFFEYLFYDQSLPPESELLAKLELSSQEELSAIPKSAPPILSGTLLPQLSATGATLLTSL